MVAVFILLSIPLLTGSTPNKQAQRDVLVKCGICKGQSYLFYIYIIMLSEETIICFQVFTLFLKSFIVLWVNRAGMGGWVLHAHVWLKQ